MSTLKRYIEIDSSFRDRARFPLPSDFEVLSSANFGSELCDCTSTIVSPQLADAPLFPDLLQSPRVYYGENLLAPSIPLETVRQRGNLPFMYQSDTGEIYLDELPVAPTDPADLTIQANANSRYVIPLDEADNRYNDTALFHVSANEFATVERSTFLAFSDFLLLQRFVVDAYQLLESGTLLTVFKNSPNFSPPSNIDRFYQGKYLRFGGQNRAIVNYYIDTSGVATFVLYAPFTSTPATGDVVDLVTDRQTLVQLQSPFATAVNTYPAYRYPYPLAIETSTQSTLVNVSGEIPSSVSVIRGPDDYYHVAFQTAEGTVGSGAAGPIYAVRSDDTSGREFSALATQIPFASLPYADSQFGMDAISTGEPSVFAILQDGANRRYVIATASNGEGTLWTTDNEVSEATTSVPVAQRIRHIRYPDGTLGFVYTDASNAVIFAYESAPGTYATYTIASPYAVMDLTTEFLLLRDTTTGFLRLYQSSSTSTVPTLVGDWSSYYAGDATSISTSGDARVAMLDVIRSAVIAEPIIVFFETGTDTLYYVTSEQVSGTKTVSSPSLIANSTSGEVVSVLTAENAVFVVTANARGVVLYYSYFRTDNLPFGADFIPFTELLVSVSSGITVLDATLNLDGCPILVHNGSVSGDSTAINVLSMCKFMPTSGSMYQIYENAPFSSGFYTPSVVDVDTVELGISTLPDANTYLWLRSQPFVDYQRTIATVTGSGSNFLRQMSVGVLADDRVIAVAERPSGSNGEVIAFVAESYNTQSQWINDVVYSKSTAGQARFMYLLLADGTPSFFLTDSSNNDYVDFVRNTATDPVSGTWVPQTVLSVAPGALFITLNAVLIEGRPSFAIVNGSALRYWRADDGIGSSWTESIAIASGITGVYNIVSVDGRPAILSTDGINLYYSIGADGAGSSWTTVNPFSFPPILDTARMGVLAAGNPVVIAYIPLAPEFVTFVGEGDGTGTWSATTQTPLADLVSFGQEILVVNGLPALTAHTDPSPELERAYLFVNTRADGLGTWNYVDLNEEHSITSTNFTVQNGTIPNVIVNTSRELIALHGVIFTEQDQQALTEINPIQSIDPLLGTVDTARFSNTITNDTVFFNQFAWSVHTLSGDSFSPLNYVGSIAAEHQPVCYDVRLQRLTLPNITLLSGNGNRIAFYPYIYVELLASYGYEGNAIISNNPNARAALFTVPIYGVNSPDRAAFVVLDGRGMTQTIKFKPWDNFRFRVRLPNGDLFQVDESDTVPPSSPNFDVQISAVFECTRRAM